VDVLQKASPIDGLDDPSLDRVRELDRPWRCGQEAEGFLLGR